MVMAQRSEGRGNPARAGIALEMTRSPFEMDAVLLSRHLYLERYSSI